MKIISKERNKLFNRTKLKFELEPGEGSREVAKEAISKQEKVGKDRVVIKEIKTQFGQPSSIGYARVYESPQALRQLEHRYLLQRGSRKSGKENEVKEEEEKKR